jgi:protein-tyrosine phosphatase
MNIRAHLALCAGFIIGVCLLAGQAAWAQTAPGSPPAATALMHMRVIPLRGQSNFRDLGGYQTASGKSVKWGLIYRSGELATLTPQDYRTIARLGIRTVFDLRTEGERQAAPTAWAGGPVQMFQSPKTGPVLGGKSAAASLSKLTPQAARAMMIALYKKLPDQYAPEYKSIFALLLANRTPLLFHCDAGKDRSGLAAALILTALDVPRSQVLWDYELSNHAVTPASLARNPADRALFKQLPPDVAKVVVAADPAYLNAAFQSIDQQYGSLNAYLATSLSVTPAQQAQLRALYLN